MKKIILVLAVSLVLSQAFPQSDTSWGKENYKVDYQSLFQKAKHQKTAAWILLGGGTGLALIGMAIISSEASENLTNDFATIFTLGLYTAPEPKHSAAGPILAITGSGAILGSIPLFLASSKNKNAARIILRDQHVFFNPQLNIKDHLPSMGIQINF
jgi:hypothetical protein